MELNRKLLGLVLKEYFIEESKEKHLAESLNDQENFELWINNLSYEQIFSLFQKGKIEVNTEQIRKWESGLSTFGKYAFWTAITGFSGIGPIIVYFYRKHTDTCYRHCKGKVEDITSCRRKCELDAAKQIVSDLKSQKNNCSKVRNPGKCIEKINKLIIKWSSRIEDAQRDLEKAQSKPRWN
jgi:hypothetical protein